MPGFATGQSWVRESRVTLMTIALVRAIDRIVVEVAFAGWHDDSDGDKAVRRELRGALGDFGLPPKGPLSEKRYAYVRENY